MSGQSEHIVVIGAGISGLAAAWRVRELAPDAKLTVLESSDRPGGVLETIDQGGYLIERSADSFITDQPWALDFCRRVGMQDDLIGTRPSNRRAYVVCRGKLQPIPEAFQIMAPTKIWSVVTSPVLSLSGKLRLFCERYVRPHTASGGEEESLEAFATRRLGREAYERLVQPLVSGIYTADPAKLSVAATLPRFIDMEQNHGSLWRGATVRARSLRAKGEQGTGARYGLFVTPRRGIGSLVEAIRRALPDDVLHCNTQVDAIGKSASDEWTLRIAGNSAPITCNKLIIATPANRAGRLCSAVDPQLAGWLGEIQYAGCAIVCLGYLHNQFGGPLPGFGFVVPAVERRRILSASFTSEKFPGRAPDEHVLIRVFIGGACQAELLDLDDRRLVEVAREELSDLLQLQGEPSMVHVARWGGAMPQYHIGHLQLVDRIERRVEELGGLAVIGSAYRGVGIPHCIHTAESSVERLLNRCTG